MREMTPEEAAEFDKKHPLGTMLIFSPKQTSAWHKRLKQKSQAAREDSASPEEMKAHIDMTNRMHELMQKRATEQWEAEQKARKNSKTE